MKKQKTTPTLPYGGGKPVHVWGAVSARGTHFLRVLDANVTAETYRAVCHISVSSCSVQTLLDFDRWRREQPGNRHGELYLLQDGAPAHTSAAITQMFPLHSLQLLQLPAKSPDINIIENIWGLLKLRTRGRRHTRAELVDTVKEQWNMLLQGDALKSLCESMPQRCAAIIQAAGGPTVY
jgi:hypothetical protein